MPEGLMHPRSHIEKEILFRCEYLKGIEKSSLSTGGKGLMNAETLLEKEENSAKTSGSFA